ncbi:autotransporter domain-containing protein [Candidatus Chlamydia sanziniae]|uniref:Polymorphic membrane protein B Family n=1 Tax=Candidatus Chlamydia sanziniae TaxID=1806891 RepID=A0A1A9HU14_9CHLA|nr:autotransporter domain-containing protein [Candidatus Chlamydia sanziniae]ANH78335.1 polymorphic membrane protein B Family [Candidatus Chlamydia sanziniae]
MKWLSATAAFAAIIPALTALTAFADPKAVELNTNHVGSENSSSDEALTTFTQKTQDSTGTTYTVVGDVNFSTFTNIPPPVTNTTPPDSSSKTSDSKENKASGSETSSSGGTGGDGASSSSTPTSRIMYFVPRFPTFLMTQNNLVGTLFANTDPFYFVSAIRTLGLVDSTPTPAPSTSSTPSPTLPTPPKPPKGGGAFYNDQTNAPITFVTNSGNPGSLTCNTISMTGQGAAIYSKGPVTCVGLKNLTFTNNLSQQAGGAIYTESTLTLLNILEMINFTSNRVVVPAPPAAPPASSSPSSSSPSAVVSVFTLKSEVEKEKSASVTESTSPVLTQETAGNGGAIYAQGSFLISKYKDMTFKSNSTSIDAGVTVPTNVIGGSGGAIFSVDTLIIEKSTGNTLFTLNSASGSGGAIYAIKAITLDALNDVRFQTNTAQNQGGAIYATDALTISNNELLIHFSANKAKGEGGAIYAKTSATFSDLIEVRFRTNKSGNYDTVIAPILPKTEKSSSSSDSSAVSGDSGDTGTKTPQGGAMYVTKDLKISGITSIFEVSSNEAQDMGGGVYIGGTFSCSDSYRIQFTKNTAKKQGGGCYCGGDVTLKNLKGKTLFQSNTSEENGGGLCLANNKSVTMETLENFCLDANTSKKSGGGAYIPQNCSLTHPNPDSKALIQPVYGAATITGNTATENGGGIYTKNASFSNLATVILDKNAATKSGGGLYTQTDTDKTDCSFTYIITVAITNNTAGDNGGGIYSQKVGFERIDNLIIESNSAKEGAGLYAGNTLTINKIETGRFSQNKATMNGGAIHANAITLSELPGDFTIANNVTESDVVTAPVETATAMYGGGLYSASTVMLKNISGTFFCTGNRVSNTGTTQDVDLQGGGIYAKTSFTLENCTGNLAFSNNSAVTKKTSTKKQIAGGAIYAPTIKISACSQPLNFLNNSAHCTTTTPSTEAANKDSFGGALAATTSVMISNNAALIFQNNYAEIGGAIGCLGPNGSDGIVTLKNNGSILFNGNSALKRGGAIYASTLTIPSGNVAFVNNTSKYDGSAIYCTKALDLTAGSMIIFENNKVTAAQSQTNGSTKTNNLGAAIYGENATNDVPVKLTAKSGSIIFRNNQCTANGGTKYCGIAGNVQLSLNVMKANTIAFYDAVNISTKNANAQTLDINKTIDSTEYEGTVIFSGEYHENKSYIPQKLTFHNGTFIFGKNAELNVVSFTQQPKTSIIMGPGTVLSNHEKEAGGIVLNNVTLDFSDLVPSAKNLSETVAPPTLRLVNRTTPATTPPGDSITITGTIHLLDPTGVLYNNPYFGKNREVTLFNIENKGAGTVTATNVQIEGNLGAKKGYLGTWNLDSSSITSKIILKWTFDKYLRWEYIPRDNYFYTNSIWGAQNSLVAVKQGLLGNMLNNARFDDEAFNNLWFSGIGSFLRKEKTEKSPTFSYHSRGYTIAMDAKPRPEFILGVSFSQVFGHSYSATSLNNYHHKGSGHSYQVSLYSGKTFAMPFLPRPLLFQGLVTYGYMKHDTTTFYPSIDEKNVANWDNLGWLVDLRLNIDLKEPSPKSTARCTFYTEAEYTGVRQKMFTELDYDPRKFEACAYKNLALPTGVAVDGAISSYSIVMYNKLAVAYLPILYRNKPISGYQILSTGETGQVNGVIPTKDAARVELSNQTYLGSYWTLYGTYTLDVSFNTLIQMANGGIRFVF